MARSHDPEVFRGWSRVIAAKCVPAEQVEAYTDRNAVLGELLVKR